MSKQLFLSFLLDGNGLNLNHKMATHVFCGFLLLPELQWFYLHNGTALIPIKTKLALGILMKLVLWQLLRGTAKKDRKRDGKT